MHLDHVLCPNYLQTDGSVAFYIAGGTCQKIFQNSPKHCYLKSAAYGGHPWPNMATKKKKAFAVMASSTVHDLQCSLHWLRSNHPLSYLPKFKISGALSFSFVLAKNDDFCVSLFSVFMATYFSSGPYFFSPGLCLSLCLWTSTHGYISHWGRVVPGYATVLLKHSYYNQN